MTNQDELRRWVQTMGTRHGFGTRAPAAPPRPGAGAACEPVRPSEVIAGSSAAQLSLGDVTDETAAEGQDIVTGSRENAATDDNDQTNHGLYAGGSNPMQSPDLGGRYALRYGIGFLCANYPGDRSDLPEVAAYQRPRSMFQQAFRNMSKSKQFDDPTAAQILAGIQTWTRELAQALTGCQQGELVVSFQGHGRRGEILGVDLVPISPSQLQTLFRQAESQRITVTYMPDACEAGHAVPRFQNHAADHVDRNVDAAEGAGAESSVENAETAGRLRDWMTHARELIQLSSAIGRHGAAMTTATQAVQQAEQRRDQAATTRAWSTVTTLNQTILRDVEAMQEQFETNMDFGNDPELRLETIPRAFTALLEALRAVRPQPGFDLDNRWNAKVGSFQDTIGNVANRIIRICDARAREHTAARR